MNLDLQPIRNLLQPKRHTCSQSVTPAAQALESDTRAEGHADTTAHRMSILRHTNSKLAVCRTLASCKRTHDTAESAVQGCSHTAESAVQG